MQVELNTLSGEIHEKVEDFCADRHPDDQLLIYLSCHGVLDGNGRLYYAAANTRRQRLAATAIAAAWLNERLDDCRARRQMVILDCCHSGAFARGAKGNVDLALQQRFEPQGRGRVVLTASRSTEYSFEGGQASGKSLPSVFTHAIIKGLRTGEADRDKDGMITVSDLYRYVYENVRAVESRQTPELWTYGAEGDLVVAHSIRGPVVEPASLPEDLRTTLESPRPRVRAIGVAELAELLDSASPSLALAAQKALQKVADEDIPSVAELARLALRAPRTSAANQVHQIIDERASREKATSRETEGPTSRQSKDRARNKAGTQGSRTRPDSIERQGGNDGDTVGLLDEKAEPDHPPRSRRYPRPLIYSGLVLLSLVSILVLFVALAGTIFTFDTNLRVQHTASSGIGTVNGFAFVISWSLTIVIGWCWVRLYRSWQRRRQAKPATSIMVLVTAAVIIIIIGAAIVAAASEGML